MAATATPVSGGPLGESGNDYYSVGTLTPGTYATGGVTCAINGAGVKLERIQSLRTGGGGYVAEWLPSTQLLKIYRQKDPANAGGADIALPEVANGVDLSAQTWDYFGVGQ